MFIVTLDVKSTHRNNPECPSRIAQQPNGSWMCVDCGAPILEKHLEAPGPSPETDVPMHVSHTDTHIHIEVGEPPICETGRKRRKDIKICDICRLPMVKSMTGLYYYCLACEISVPLEKRGDTTVLSGKGCRRAEDSKDVSRGHADGLRFLGVDVCGDQD